MKLIRKNLKEKGWMQKMAGTSISFRTCLKMARKYGTYLVKGKIGCGMVSNAKSRTVYPQDVLYGTNRILVS